MRLAHEPMKIFEAGCDQNKKIGLLTSIQKDVKQRKRQRLQPGDDLV